AFRQRLRSPARPRVRINQRFQNEAREAPMKRVVTAVNEQGRSFVVSIEEMQSEQTLRVWSYEPGDIAEFVAGVPDEVATNWIEPPPGGANWIYSTLPPGFPAQTAHPSRPNLDDFGWHTTRTIDFDFIVAGQLTLVLDEDSIDLE